MVTSKRKFYIVVILLFRIIKEFVKNTLQQTFFTLERTLLLKFKSPSLFCCCFYQPGRKRGRPSKSPSPKKKRKSQSPEKTVEKVVDKPPAKRGRPKAKAQASPEKELVAKKSSPRKKTATPQQILKEKTTNQAGGEQREIHKRLRRKNVPTRDFAQSP